MQSINACHSRRKARRVASGSPRTAGDLWPHFNHLSFTLHPVHGNVDCNLSHTVVHRPICILALSIVKRAAIVLVGEPLWVIRPVAVLYMLALLTSRARSATTLSAVSLPLSVRQPSRYRRPAACSAVTVPRVTSAGRVAHVWLLLRRYAHFSYPVIVSPVAGWSVPVPLAVAVPFSVARDVGVDIIPGDYRPAPRWWSVSVSVSITVHIRPTSTVVIDRGRGSWREAVRASLPGWQSLPWSKTASMRCRRVPPTVDSVAVWFAATVEAGVWSARTIVRPTPYSSTLWSGGQGSLSVVELPAVEFVAFLHDRQVAGLGRERSSVKVRVLEGVDRVDPLLPVESQQFSEESYGTRSVPATSSVGRHPARRLAWGLTSRNGCSSHQVGGAA